MGVAWTLLMYALLFAALWLSVREGWWRLRARHQAVADALEEGAVVDRAWGRFAVEGRRRGRRVAVRFGQTLELRVAVPAGTAPLELEDCRAAREWLAGAGAQAREALGAVQRLADCLVTHIEVKDGWLSAHRAPSDYAQRPESVLQVLDALAALVPLLERAPLTIRVAGAERAAVAWTEGERVLCPYCRDALRAEGDDVTACDDCRTAHHRACLAEAGGCTVFGCRGGPRRDQVSARA